MSNERADSFLSTIAIAGFAVLDCGIATIPAALLTGSIAISKVGEQTVKVVR